MRPDNERQSFFDAVHAASRGLRFVLREPNIIRQLALLCIAILLAALLRFTPIEWALIFVCAGGVLGSEVLNTALEHTLDIVDPTFNPAVGVAKDIAALSVVVWSVVSVMVEFCILIPHVMAVLGE